jgi:hypothetical protein
VIVANPPGDDAFVALVTAIVDAGIDTPEALQAELRTRYPLAVVRPRELSGEHRRLWYAYRDGRWQPITDEETR